LNLGFLPTMFFTRFLPLVIPAVFVPLGGSPSPGRASPMRSLVSEPLPTPHVFVPLGFENFAGPPGKFPPCWGAIDRPFPVLIFSLPVLLCPLFLCLRLFPGGWPFFQLPGLGHYVSQTGPLRPSTVFELCPQAFEPKAAFPGHPYPPK